MTANNEKIRTCVVHYGEIALKGRNRHYFENLLISNLCQSLGKPAVSKAQCFSSRIFIDFKGPIAREALKNKIQKVFGVVHFSPCFFVEPRIDLLKEALGSHLSQMSFKSFAVRTRRTAQHFPVGSQWVNEEIGTFVKEKTGWKVDLENPEVTIFILLYEEKIIFFFEKIPGPGGIPVGAAGKVVSLLSGGIDSPVAAYRVMRRGAKPIFLHFHSAPFTTEESKEKVWKLAEILSQYSQGGEIIFVPFGNIQREIIDKTPEPYRVLLYRRMMVRIANALAKKNKAKGLVTGEVLGQVASQTLSNLGALDAVSELPILRPLIGMDKEEVILEARKIGTFEISIEPHEDCCSFMLPVNPKTRSTPEELNQIEEGLDIASLVVQGLEIAQKFLI